MQKRRSQRRCEPPRIDRVYRNRVDVFKEHEARCRLLAQDARPRSNS